MMMMMQYRNENVLVGLLNSNGLRYKNDIVWTPTVHLSQTGVWKDDENHGEVYLSIMLTQKVSDKSWGSDYNGKFLPYEPYLDGDEEGFWCSTGNLILQMRTAKVRNTKTPILHSCNPS
jgi:hypothetical protein